jgi:hypothetical protein
MPNLSLKERINLLEEDLLANPPNIKWTVKTDPPGLTSHIPSRHRNHPKADRKSTRLNSSHNVEG